MISQIQFSSRILPCGEQFLTVLDLDTRLVISVSSFSLKKWLIYSYTKMYLLHIQTIETNEIPILTV